MGFVQSALDVHMASGGRCPPAALGLAARNLLQSFGTHKLDLGSGIPKWSNGCKWQQWQTVRLWDVQMVSAANIAGTYEFGLLAQFQPQWTHLQVAAVIKPCGSRICKMALSQNLGTYRVGLGSRVCRWTHPCEWQQ